MKIKPVTKNDLHICLPLIKSFCDEMGYPFDADSLIEFMTSCIDRKWYLTVVEDNGHLIGMGGAMIAPHYADRNHLQAIEFVWHSRPDIPKMTRAKVMILLAEDMERYAHEKGYPLVLSSNGLKSGGLATFLERRGYVLTDCVFTREV
jgi:hypothetical protein